MAWLIWVGAAVTVGGVGLLLWTVIAVVRARRAGDDALRSGLQRAVVTNLLALGVSALGLMMVVIGLLLA